jgi:hypothetical protein
MRGGYVSLQKPLFVRVWSAARAAALVCVLSTTGYAGAAGLKVSPGTMSFGKCVVGGTSGAETVTVTNDSRESVKIASVSLSSLEFAYSGPALPVTLAPGQSFRGAVMFLPTAARKYSARLTFETNRSSFWSSTVELVGTGTATAVSVSVPSALPAAVTPTITWAAPAAVNYGTALSAAQLDATASTAGNFAYSAAPGTVLTAGSHTLSVTFTPTNTTAYTAATDSVVLTVNKLTPSITWAMPTAISYGTALSGAQLDATASTAGSFAYSSAAGTVLTAGSHTLSVTFTPSDTTDYNTATGSVLLTVNKATPTITWATPAAITSGKALSAAQLDATANVAGSFAYSPASGTVLSTGSQTLTATFTPTDTTDYNTASSSVTLIVNTANKVTPTITWTTPTAISYGTALSSTQLDAAASTAGSFAYSPALGTVEAAGSQTLTVTFTPTDTTDYNSATGSVVLTVNKATPTITWAAPAAITSGTALSAAQLDATANVAGSFAYSPALGTVLSAGSQTLTVTFTPTDTTDYNTATGSVALTVNTVNKVTPTITWTTPTAISYGTALSTAQLDATASTAGSFAYSPALGTVEAAGSQTLTVTFTPTDTNDYNSATGSVVLTVNKVTPTITWATPTAMTSGMALSAAQLDASANTAGSFAYAPALGTVLSAGSQTLSVTFTPNDTTDYNKATASVMLTVNSATPATGTLTVNPTSVSFGNVNIGTNGSQTVTLTNSGSGSVAISNVSTTSGVGVSGASTGMVLTGGQSVTLGLTFAVSGAGSVTGGVTVSSNASNSSLTIPLSANGVNPSVSLSWSADSSATGGYNVYSSTVSGGPYNKLTSTPITAPAYTDGTVQAGLTYYYVVTAIDATTNMQSSYSNQASVVVP